MNCRTLSADVCGFTVMKTKMFDSLITERKHFFDAASGLRLLK